MGLKLCSHRTLVPMDVILSQCVLTTRDWHKPLVQWFGPDYLAAQQVFGTSELHLLWCPPLGGNSRRNVSSLLVWQGN